MRAALYSRISTNDGRQHIENQAEKLREFAGRMNWTVAGEYCDQESGTRDKRPELDRLMRQAARRAFDVVLVFDLSRLTRGGPAKAFDYIARLNHCKVEFWSMTEEHFRTAGAAGPLLIAIAAHIAEQERTTMRARIKAGLDRAKKSGKHIGRPREFRIDPARVRKLKEQGKSIREIARVEKCSKSTIERVMANR